MKIIYQESCMSLLISVEQVKIILCKRPQFSLIFYKFKSVLLLSSHVSLPYSCFPHDSRATSDIDLGCLDGTVSLDLPVLLSVLSCGEKVRFLCVKSTVFTSFLVFVVRSNKWQPVFLCVILVS